MNDDRGWISHLTESWGDQFRSAAELLPGVLGAALLFVAGWIIARLVRRGVRSLASGTNRWLARRLATGPMAAVRISPLMITLLGEIFFWALLVVAATLALRVAGFDVIATWLDRVTLYAPNLLAAFSILIVGVLLSAFAREQLVPSTASGSGQRAWMPLAAQTVILALTLIVVLDQLGLEMGLLIAVAVVSFAGAVFTLGATFALGARCHAANLVGVQASRNQLAVGQWLQVEGLIGQVVEISPTQIVLDTEGGRTLLPGHFLSEHVATILDRNPHEETAHE